MQILYVPYKKIDKQRYDETITKAHNGSVYAYSWYLDAFCKWDILCTPNYEYVMPLPTKNLLRIQKIIYQPFFIQQLGIFTYKKLDFSIVNQFINSIPKSCKHLSYNLNHANVQTLKTDYLQGVDRNNFLLDINTNYETLNNNYHDNLKRNIAKAKKHNLWFSFRVSLEFCIDFYQKNAGYKSPVVKKTHYAQLRKAIENAMNSAMAFCVGITNDKQEIIASNIFLYSHNKLINLLPASNAEGIEKQAMSFLMDQIIQKYCERDNLILDFEGSNIEGVARFYKQFGSQNFPYFTLQYNKLIWPLKLFKK